MLLGTTLTITGKKKTGREQYRIVSGLQEKLHFLGSTTQLSVLLTATCDPDWITAVFEVGLEMNHVNLAFVKIL